MQEKPRQKRSESLKWFDQWQIIFKVRIPVQTHPKMVGGFLKSPLYLVLLASFVFSSGCIFNIHDWGSISETLGFKGPLFFTEELRRQYSLQEEEIKNLQFYTSQEIILHRKISPGTNHVNDGNIISKDDTRVYEVIIPSAQRGRPIEFDSNGLMLRFDSGQTLRFVPIPVQDRVQSEKGLSEVESPFIPGEIRYYLFINDDGMVPYKGQMWLPQKATQGVALFLEKNTLLGILKARENKQ